MSKRFGHLRRVVPSTAELVTLGEAKAQLRILHADDDVDLAFKLIVAKEWVEDYANQSLLYESWVVNFDYWPTVDEDFSLILPRPPLSVVEYVKYWDGDDEEVELSEEDDFTVDELGGVIQFVSGFSYPTLSLNRALPIEIGFRAGYGDAAEDVPARFRHAVRLKVSDLHNVEGAGVAAEKLLAPIRVRPL